MAKRLTAWRSQLRAWVAQLGKQAPKPLQRLGKTLASVLGAQVGALLVLDTIVALALSSLSPVFFTGANIVAMGVAMSGNVLAAMGAALVLLTGGFDLSIGSAYGLGGVICAVAMKQGFPIWPSLALGVLTGTVIGLINGFIVTKLQINPFIATMGTMTVGRGLINVITQGYAVSGLPPAFMKLVSAKILGLPPSFVIMLLVFVLTDLALRFWRPVRQLYYIGGSAPYARLVGINVTRAQTLAYMFAGTMAGLGGVLFTMRTGAGSQQAGTGIEMMGIVAAFLGGVGFGGAGSGLGAFLGALLVALVVNAINLLGIAVLWQNVVTGTFLIVAALIGMAQYQKATQHIRKERRKEAEEA